jgi:hypothetical protein
MAPAADDVDGGRLPRGSVGVDVNTMHHGNEWGHWVGSGSLLV